MQKRVIVVGGGLAGLAAAVAIADAGVPVLLLESRPRLGGRASSFVDQKTGELIDNCQHVAMGCCTNLHDFCRRLGLDDLLRTESSLTFIGPEGQQSRFAAGLLPAPLHLAGAFAKLRFLTWGEKLSLARALNALARDTTAADQSFADWLRAHGQTERLMERFWSVVLVSALSETLDRIDVAYARKVFVDGFMTHRDGWTVQIPQAPLDELYGSRVTHWLQARGGAVRLQSGAAELTAENGHVRSVRLRSGDEITADEFVLAVPCERVAGLVPESLQSDTTVTSLSRLEAAPISSVHLWFDREITKLPHAVLVGRLSQWLFNRHRILKRGSGHESYEYQVVISASRMLAGDAREDTIAKVVAELADIWPDVSEARLQHARVVTEHRAVFSVTPGAERLRPGQQSPIPNLQFAGDWTRTGWPATMEGAVRSGYLAAENVLERLGQPRRILCDDLPCSRWSQWLLGLTTSGASGVRRPA
ncbi:15-cis-phytoene desaturase [Maioricimonas rarisocia]|uniref:15-cis-phytoene desaturase n=1 Tax=Maioricimonas rarisocia TaxID=2528026 RepID=A0A517Z093_9PLAN|nr:hydroxysqualene dehydroxylase HpnE [Maioricimonas rarisocia]QDU35904.1 15-cis-phytoene desaturase [Maioricimonas rarisocia]